MNSPRLDPATTRILAIHAHPDDIEFQCAGTLALLKRRGCQLVVATMTPGDKGSAELGREQISEVRREEARQAAKLLDAECMCLEFPDLAIDINDDSHRRVTEAIRRARPHVVLTAPPVDYMTDHEVTSRLVRDACFAASVPNYATGQWDPAPRLPQIPYLYYMDPIEGVDWFGNPVPYDFIVDISDVFELKLQTLACHESQRNWLRTQHHMDQYLENCRLFSGQRGQQIGVKFGEAFRQHKGHPYPRNNALGELLGM